MADAKTTIAAGMAVIGLATSQAHPEQTQSVQSQAEQAATVQEQSGAEAKAAAETSQDAANSEAGNVEQHPTP